MTSDNSFTVSNPRVSIINPQAASDPTMSYEVISKAPFTPAIMLAPWSHLLFNETNRRHSTNFVSTSYLVYDFDEGVPTLAEVTSQLAIMRMKHAVGPSKSHQKVKVSGQQSKAACDRFRVVLYLDTEVTSIELYKHLYIAVAGNLGWGNFDKQTKDVARFWAGCTSVTSSLDKGETVKVADYPYSERARQPVSMVKSKLAAARPKGRPNERTVTFLLEGASAGQWHGEFIAAALDLKAQGYSEEEAELQLKKASPEGELDAHDLTQLRDVYLHRDPFHAERLNWPKMVQTKNGDVVDKQSTVNFIKAVTEFMPGAPFKYYRNEVNNKLYINSKEGLELNDVHINAAYAFCSEAGLAKDLKLIDNAISQAAEIYHPIKDFVEAEKWDGIDRIPELFKTIKLEDGVSEEQAHFYQEIYLRRWFYAAIHRAYRSDVENGVLVFMGPQGGGKSRWFKKLATKIWAQGFSDALIDPKNKDHQAYLVDSFMHHIAELDATTSQKHAGELKDYLNKQTVTFRRPYARLTETKNTMCSFCATVNPATFLQDSTGSRRFMVIPIARVNPDHDINIQQLAAQAYEEAVIKDYRTWMNEEEIAQVNNMNTNFQFEDDYEGAIRSRVTPGDDRMTLKDILESVDIKPEFLSKTQKEKINSILKMKGVKTVNYSGRQMWCVDRKTLVKLIASNTLEMLTEKKLITSKEV